MYISDLYDTNAFNHNVLKIRPDHLVVITREPKSLHGVVWFNQNQLNHVNYAILSQSEFLSENTISKINVMIQTKSKISNFSSTFLLNH